VVGPLNWGGGFKPPEPLSKKIIFFYNLFFKLPEPHETQSTEKLINI